MQAQILVDIRIQNYIRDLVFIYRCSSKKKTFVYDFV